MIALERLETGGMFAPHFKPNLAPTEFVNMYGCLANRLIQERQKNEGKRSAEGKWGNLILQVVPMLLSKVDISILLPLTFEIQAVLERNHVLDTSLVMELSSSLKNNIQ